MNKRLGFITVDRVQDVSVSVTQVQGETLAKGDLVVFDTRPGKRGPESVGVQRVSG